MMHSAASAPAAPCTASATRQLRTPAWLEPAPGEGPSRVPTSGSGLLAAPLLAWFSLLHKEVGKAGIRASFCVRNQVYTTEITPENRGLPSNPEIPLPGISLKEPKTLIRQNISPSVFTAALLTMATTGKQPKCPSVEEWTKQLWGVHTVQCCSAVRKKKILPFATAWMDLENIMLSEIRTSETRQMPLGVSLMWSLMSKLN